MKITIEIKTESIPEAFRPDDPAGKENLFSFLWDKLVINSLEKAANEQANAPYMKAFFDQNGMEGQAHVDAIREINQAEVSLGRMLCEALRIE